MSKIIFEFDSIEDKEEIEIYANTLRMHAVLCDLRDELRSCLKHGTPTKRDHYWSDRLYKLLEERRVDIK